MSTARNSKDKMNKMKKMKRTSSSSSIQLAELNSTDRNDKIKQIFKKRQNELDYRHDPENISPIEPCHTYTDERYGNRYGKHPKKVSDWENRHTRPLNIDIGELMYPQQPQTPVGFERPGVSPATQINPNTGWRL